MEEKSETKESKLEEHETHTLTKKEKLKKKIKEEMPPEYKNIVPDFMIDLVISTMSDESIPDDVDNSTPKEGDVINQYANYTFPKVPGVEILALEPTALKILARTVHQMDDEELTNNIKEMIHNKIKLSIANSKLNITKAQREIKTLTGGGDYFDEEDCTFFR